MRRALILGTAAAMAFASPVVAQERQGQPARGARAQQPDRVALERQVREALWRTVRTQVGLNDRQMAQLVRVDQKYEAQRREVFREEMQVRLGLRMALTDADAATRDNAAISRSLDRLIQLQRRRVDLLEAEQKELATFMSPVQRAQYQALQEQVRRRMEAMRGRGPGATMPGPRGGRRGPPPS